MVYPEGTPAPDKILKRLQRSEQDPAVTIITGEKSIKISQIRTLQSQLATANSFNRTRLVLITPANLLTTIAQQALLKIIEEPPINTHIVMAVNTTTLLLPTVLSRCQILTIKEQTDYFQQQTLWQRWRNLTWKDKVCLTQELPTNRQEALELLQQELLQLRYQDATAQNVHWQLRVLTTINSLRHNVNVGLSWEYLLLW